MRLSLVRSLATNEVADDSGAGNTQHDADDRNDLLPPELLSLKERYPEQWAKIEARRRKLARQLGQPPDPEPKAPPQAEVFHVHTDHLGTPREITDNDGHLVWTANYAAWGRAVTANPPRRILGRQGNTVAETLEEQTHPIECHLRFQGQYFDAESGLHYNRFRYYDPDIGRFACQDPIGLQGGINAYMYAPNPLAWIDPSGLNRIFSRCRFSAPSGKEHTVYQQEIDWNLPVNTRDGVKTNLELATSGKSPFVVKNGQYSQINLHHSKQDANGSLFELSANSHERYRYSNALHPHLPGAHPYNPVDRESFNLDREEYWRQRAARERARRIGSCSCPC